MKSNSRVRPFQWLFISSQIGIGAVLVFFYSNCSSSHDSIDDSSSGFNAAAILKSLRSQKEYILNAKCASCHNENTTDNDLRQILSTEYLEENNYINRGYPQTSRLYLDVIDGIMPPENKLSDYEVHILRDWIAAEGDNFDTYIGGTPIDPGGGGPTSFTQVRAVLNQYCVNCHRAGGEPPRLDVDAATLREALHQQRDLVIPNNASNSLLLQSFSSMPQGGALGVNSPEANIVRSWINSGAQ